MHRVRHRQRTVDVLLDQEKCRPTVRQSLSARRRSPRLSVVPVPSIPRRGAPPLGRSESICVRASICCCPPDIVPARWPSRPSSAGKACRARSTLLSEIQGGVARRRFSATVRVGYTPRPSGIRQSPRRALTCGFFVVTSSSPSTILPAFARIRPAIVRRSVVLPAPFGPRSAVTDPGAISNPMSFSTTVSP